MKDVSKPNNFIWLDSTKFNYINWIPNEPNGEYWEPCVHIDERFENMWNDLSCDRILGSYICERRLPIKTAINRQNERSCPDIGYHFSSETLKCHAVGL